MLEFCRFEEEEEGVLVCMYVCVGAVAGGAVSGYDAFSVLLECQCMQVSSSREREKLCLAA